MTLLYVIRHGETDYNRNGRYQGQSDVPLNAEGRNQCRTLAARMSAIPLDVVYTSDLSRAQESARMIAGAHTVVLDTRLREVNVGRCIGLTAAEIAAREPGFYAAMKTDPDGTPFPGGESNYDVKLRTLEAFSAIRARYPEGRVAVVTHGGVIKLLVGEVLGLPMSERHRILLENCGLTVIEWGNDLRRLRSLNDTGHLATPPSDVKADF